MYAIRSYYGGFGEVAHLMDAVPEFEPGIPDDVEKLLDDFLDVVTLVGLV